MSTVVSTPVRVIVHHGPRESTSRWIQTPDRTSVVDAAGNLAPDGMFYPVRRLAYNAWLALEGGGRKAVQQNDRLHVGVTLETQEQQERTTS